MTAVQKCYADVPEANLLEHIFDVKTWLSAHLFQLHNHSHPHIFRFKTGESGEVVMHYKDWSESSWEPHGNGIKLFKVYTLHSSLFKLTSYPSYYQIYVLSHLLVNLLHW